MFPPASLHTLPPSSDTSSTPPSNSGCSKLKRCAKWSVACVADKGMGTAFLIAICWSACSLGSSTWAEYVPVLAASVVTAHWNEPSVVVAWNAPSEPLSKPSLSGCEAPQPSGEEVLVGVNVLL